MITLSKLQIHFSSDLNIFAELELLSRTLSDIVNNNMRDQIFIKILAAFASVC